MNSSKSNIGIKFKEIRELLGLSRKKMELILGLPERSLERIEKQKGKVSFEYVQLLLKEFPEFTYWISLGETDVEAGQLDPKIYQGFLLVFNKRHPDKAACLFEWKNQEHIAIAKVSYEQRHHKMFMTLTLGADMADSNKEAFLKWWRGMRPDYPISESINKVSVSNVKKYNEALKSGEISAEEYYKQVDSEYDEKK
jgi:transcriptional regulator with XRE-family HTH domain